VQNGSVINLNNAAAAGNGGTIVLNQSILNQSVTLPGGNAIVVITNAIIGTNGANRQIDGPIRGTNATLTFNKSGTALMTLNGDLNGFSGTITNEGTGTLRFNSGGGNTCTGGSNALWVLNLGSTLQNRNGGVIDFGGLQGFGNLREPQNANNNTVNYRIGALNTSTLFEGTIFDNNTNANNRLVGTSKIGSGTLTLNNATLTYFGPTAISNGVFALTGFSGLSNSTPIIVASPGVLNVAGRDAGTLYLGEVGVIQTNRVQTLRGTGNIQGNVSIGALGRLEPGFSIGTLTVSGTATLGGTNLMEFDTTNSPTSDRLVAASIVYGGTLILTNVGGVPTGTNTLQLFSGALSGSFTTVITQAISGVSYDLSQLNSAGIVKVIGAPGVNTNPTNMTFSAAGGQLTVSWPSSHIGWRLQAQTNAINLGLRTNWVTVAGSDTTNLVIFPMSQTNGTVFFRMIYP